MTVCYIFLVLSRVFICIHSVTCIIIKFASHSLSDLFGIIQSTVNLNPDLYIPNTLHTNLFVNASTSAVYILSWKIWPIMHCMHMIGI